MPGRSVFLRALEAFDSGTGRQNNIWVTQFPTVKLAGTYKVYLRQPDGLMANFGDGGNSNGFAGRDNFGMAILNDRFPDPHFVWMMTNSPNDWNSGDSGQTGLVYKLIYFPYVNGPGSHDPSDLPLAAKFGPDVIMRSGWGATDTYLTYSGSMKGVYHRHDDAGTFSVFKNSLLVGGQPYTLSSPVYGAYNRRTIGGNTLLIKDPADCWKDSGPDCGMDYWGNKLVNDGGQLTAFRRYFPQFSTDQFQISRLWSGSVYSDVRYSALYSEIDAPSQPTFSTGAGYEHVKHDLTKSYVNAYSGLGDNPRVKVSATEGVVRELIHFQPTLGSLNPMVIFDRVTSTNASFKKSWIMHTVNAPSVDGAASSPGDTTYNAASVTKADNGTGRLYVSHLLPAAPKVRTVGGDACQTANILGATNANPAVYYMPDHGLTVGEAIKIETGAQKSTGGGPTYWPNWLIDRYFGSYTVATIPDPDHFTVSSGYASDTTSYQPWTTAFTSGNGAPAGAGAFTGQVYYQQDATGGKTVWQWNAAGAGTWVNLADQRQSGCLRIQVSGSDQAYRLRVVLLCRPARAAGKWRGASLGRHYG